MTENIQAFHKKCLDVLKVPFAFDNSIEKYTLENLYYDARARLNGNDFSDDVQMAVDFLIVRQLAFSGMIRRNADGELNMAYGWYQKISLNYTDQHQKFLKNNSTILHGDFQDAISLAKKNDFLFVDPPYRTRVDPYAMLDFQDDDHIRLAQALHKTKAKWLIVHCDDPLYRELYQDYKIIDKNFKYNVNFKNRKTDAQKVSHLYIKNY